MHGADLGGVIHLQSLPIERQLQLGEPERTCHHRLCGHGGDIFPEADSKGGPPRASGGRRDVPLGARKLLESELGSEE